MCIYMQLWSFRTSVSRVADQLLACMCVRACVCSSQVFYINMQVVSREAIYYGVADSSFKASLVNWALPYAQRYLCNTHPDKYSQLKQSGFDTLNSLRVVVVEKLFYRNVIKGCGMSSEKRVESTCLLQVCHFNPSLYMYVLLLVEELESKE